MLNEVRNGIQINMRNMNRTSLRPSGKTASVGGGTLQHELTAALFSHGKQAGESLTNFQSGKGACLPTQP